MTQASENLFISRPSLSRAINRLELEFNVVLFKRLSNGVEPTEAGHEMYLYAENILNEQKHLHQAMLKYSSNDDPFVLCKIGLSKFLFTSYGQILFDTLSSIFPHIYFDFLLSKKSTQLNFYQEVDISIVLLPLKEVDAYSQKIDPAFYMKHLCTIPVSVWVSEKSSLAKVPIITSSLLKEYVFCSLKDDFSIENLTGIFGQNRDYWNACANVELENNFIDKIEKFNHYTIDLPLSEGDYLYTKLFQDRKIILKPTNEKLSLEIIYKSTYEDLYSIVSNVFLTSKKYVSKEGTN